MVTETHTPSSRKAYFEVVEKKIISCGSNRPGSSTRRRSSSICHTLNTSWLSGEVCRRRLNVSSRSIRRSGLRRV